MPKRSLFVVPGAEPSALTCGGRIEALLAPANSEVESVARHRGRAGEAMHADHERSLSEQEVVAR